MSIEPDGATPLSPEEKEGLKQFHIETRGELNQLEQQNIQEGLRWFRKQRKHKDYLTESFLLDLHLHLFGEVWSWAGHFRLSDKNIGVDYLQISVELRKLLDDARYWIKNSTFQTTEFAARFHHRLVKIHPFPNGNGRHSRIMTDIVLTKLLGGQKVNWGASSLDEENAHRAKYIAALREADQHDYASLISFIRKP